MKRSAPGDRVEGRRIGELLEREGLKDRALGRARVNRNDGVPEINQRPGEPAIAASDLEHPRRSRWQLGCRKFEDVHLRATSSSSTPKLMYWRAWVRPTSRHSSAGTPL